MSSSFDLFARSYDLIRLEMVATPTQLTLTWNTQLGLVYRVQSSSDSLTWTNLGAEQTAVGYRDSLTVSSVSGRAFYRVIRPQ